MLKLITSLFFFLSLTTTTLHAEMIISAEDSSIGHEEGNGGNTSTEEKVTADDIAAVVRTSARAVISAWLYQQELQYFQNVRKVNYIATPIDKLFYYQLPVYSRNYRDIEIRMASSCLNFYKQPVDASIYGMKKNTLCISPFMMAPKLNKSNYKNEIYALIIHEISHLSSYNEAEAVALQKYALNDLNGSDYKNLLLESSLLSRSVQAQIELLDRALKDDEYFNKYPLELAKYQTNFETILNNVDSKRFSFRYLTAMYNDHLTIEQTRLNIFYHFITGTSSLYFPTENEKLNSIKWLDEAYGGTEILSVDEINDNLSTPITWVYTRVFTYKERIARPKNWSDLNEQLTYVRELYGDMGQELLDLIKLQFNTYTTSQAL